MRLCSSAGVQFPPSRRRVVGQLPTLAVAASGASPRSDRLPSVEIMSYGQCKRQYRAHLNSPARIDAPNTGRA